MYHLFDNFYYKFAGRCQKESTHRSILPWLCPSYLTLSRHGNKGSQYPSSNSYKFAHRGRHSKTLELGWQPCHDRGLSSDSTFNVILLSIFQYHHHKWQYGLVEKCYQTLREHWEFLNCSLTVNRIIDNNETMFLNPTFNMGFLNGTTRKTHSTLHQRYKKYICQTLTR